MQREALKYVFDIKIAAEKIQRFVAGKSQADYLRDELLQSGVERQFEIIGEAIGKLHNVDPRLIDSITDYQKMISFRNVLIHGYATIDPLIVWGVVEANLKKLIGESNDILES